MTQEMTVFVCDQIRICRNFGCRTRTIEGRKALVNLETGDYVYYDDINATGEKGEYAVERLLHKLKGSPNFSIFEPNVPIYDIGRNNAIKIAETVADGETEEEI